MPRFLEPVHRLEPVIYRWLGVGWVKRLVATRFWPMLNGIELPPKPSSQREFLIRMDMSTKGAEVCHGATFVLALVISFVCLAVDRISFGFWILGFNIALNGYPVLLQRSNRWRVSQVREAQSAQRRK